MEKTVEERIRDLAEEVISMAKAQILVRFRFLDRALFELTPNASDMEETLSTDGRSMNYSPRYLLRGYRENSAFVLRACAHMLMHCLFRHMFVHGEMDQELWDLATDIAAEGMMEELALPQLLDAPGAPDRRRILAGYESEVKPLTAEKLYHFFRLNPPDAASRQQMLDLFTVDDHALWYVRDDVEEEDEGEGEDGEQQEEKPGESADQGGDSGSAQQAEDASGEDGDAEKAAGEDKEEGSGGETAPLPLSEAERQALEDMWRDISERMQTDMETFGRQQGYESGKLSQALRALNRERYDYAAFLRKFATRTEVMKLSPDEFDYVFYTYGMELYGDMPLIEPLEYREDSRIRDFVIAIDTSGSCSGETVQQFLQKTYNIIKEEESFDRRFNLHLIQCDAKVQEDKVIHTQEEFDDYILHMQLRGFGGTDFRPVFSYVEQLRAAHAFRDLRGLIYFTDGFGIYPQKQTDYTTAFVFLDDENTGQHLVPSWAIRLIIESQDLEE